MKPALKRALFDLISTFLIVVSVIVVGVLFKTPLTDFVSIMKSLGEWIVSNYVLCIVGSCVIVFLVVLRNFLIKI